jgi:hypothetical protein
VAAAAIGAAVFNAVRARIRSSPIAAEAVNAEIRPGHVLNSDKKLESGAARAARLISRSPFAPLWQCSTRFPRSLGCAARSIIVEDVSQRVRSPHGRTEFSRKKPAHIRAMGEEVRAALGIFLVKNKALATIARVSSWMPSATFHKQQKTNNK